MGSARTHSGFASKIRVELICRSAQSARPRYMRQGLKPTSDDGMKGRRDDRMKGAKEEGFKGRREGENL